MTLNTFDEINEFRQELESKYPNNGLFYRGNKINCLLPSLVPINNKLSSIQLERIENKLLDEFKFYYTENISANEATTYDWLLRIKAREHGLCSRLMDWTHTFYKALDFATFNINASIQKRYVYLWILIIESDEILNFKDYKNNVFKNLNKTFFLRNAIPAKHINFLASHRQSIQGGGFLVQPTNLIATPINEQPYFSNKLFCVQIPIGNANSIRQDIIYKVGEDINKKMLIEENNSMDIICEKLNTDYLYSLNKLLIANSLQ